MPVYKDEKTNTWFCRFYYKDYTGKRKQKMKRGFQLQREAKQWESDFLAKMAGSPEMPFAELYALYLEDRKNNVKPTTFKKIETTGRIYIIPAFGKCPVNQITPADIRKWQNDLKTKILPNGEHLQQSTTLEISRHLSSIFNYAVRFYGLPVNPCRIAGNCVRKRIKRISFWTKEQFDQFIDTFDKKDPFYTVFMILYYTGMRKGELQALTPADISLSERQISITKTLVRLDGEDIIQTPKTPGSVRQILIPDFLCDIIREYEGRFYDLDPEDRLFPWNGATYNYSIKSHAIKAGLTPIKVHDLRHSHASLLIDLGFSALLVAERLGHENVATTLNIYSHLFPSKQSELIDRLQKLFIENNIK